MFAQPFAIERPEADFYWHKPSDGLALAGDDVLRASLDLVNKALEALFGLLNADGLGHGALPRCPNGYVAQ